jgi:glycosyltransferase involved in cell wall biosynthesis
MRQPKIVIATTGQPSTNPRTMKEVEALTAAGFDVKVFYSFWAHWARSTDRHFLEAYPGVFTEVGGNPYTAKRTWYLSRIWHKLFRLAGSHIPGFRKYAMERASLSLIRAIAQEPADLYIAHNIGALPAIAMAAGRRKAPFGYDAEDYHRGQFYTPGSVISKAIRTIEDEFIPTCNYVTAASPLIARAYGRLFPAASITTINNVFSKRYLQPLKDTNKAGLSLFWFSQTVGPERGIEVVVDAMNRLKGYEISLCLLGECSEEYKSILLSRSENKEVLTFMAPVPLSEIFVIAANFDIGLSTEIPYCDNRNFCLTNKLFSYLLAGNCIIASDTLAQKNFLSEYEGIGLLYRHADPDDLALQLKKLYMNRSLLEDCRRKSIGLAASTLNWEEESKEFLSVVAKYVDVNHSDH